MTIGELDRPIGDGHPPGLDCNGRPAAWRFSSFAKSVESGIPRTSLHQSAYSTRSRGQ